MTAGKTSNFGKGLLSTALMKKYINKKTSAVNLLKKDRIESRLLHLVSYYILLLI